MSFDRRGKGIVRRGDDRQRNCTTPTSIDQQKKSLAKISTAVTKGKGMAWIGKAKE